MLGEDILKSIMVSSISKQKSSKDLLDEIKFENV